MSKTPSIRELLTFYKNILEKSPQKKIVLMNLKSVLEKKK